MQRRHCCTHRERVGTSVVCAACVVCVVRVVCDDVCIC